MRKVVGLLGGCAGRATATVSFSHYGKKVCLLSGWTEPPWITIVLYLHAAPARRERQVQTVVPKVEVASLSLGRKAAQPASACFKTRKLCDKRPGQQCTAGLFISGTSRPSQMSLNVILATVDGLKATEINAETDRAGRTHKTGWLVKTAPGQLSTPLITNHSLVSTQ